MPYEKCENVLERQCKAVHKKVPKRVSRTVPKKVCGGSGSGSSGTGFGFRNVEEDAEFLPEKQVQPKSSDAVVFGN